MQVEQFNYDNKIVRDFGVATVVWGIIGMTVGLIAALQLVWPEVNLGLQYSTFGRIRPLHTNAVVFAFVGNAIFMGAYYSMQRVLKARMYSDRLSKIHFLGMAIHHYRFCYYPTFRFDDLSRICRDGMAY